MELQLGVLLLGATKGEPGVRSSLNRFFGLALDRKHVHVRVRARTWRCLIVFGDLERVPLPCSHQVVGVSLDLAKLDLLILRWQLGVKIRDRAWLVEPAESLLRNLLLSLPGQSS